MNANEILLQKVNELQRIVAELAAELQDATPPPGQAVAAGVVRSRPRFVQYQPLLNLALDRPEEGVAHGDYAKYPRITVWGANGPEVQDLTLPDGSHGGIAWRYSVNVTSADYNPKNWSRYYDLLTRKGIADGHLAFTVEELEAMPPRQLNRRRG